MPDATKQPPRWLAELERTDREKADRPRRPASLIIVSMAIVFVVIAFLYMSTLFYDSRLTRPDIHSGECRLLWLRQPDQFCAKRRVTAKAGDVLLVQYDVSAGGGAVKIDLVKRREAGPAVWETRVEQSGINQAEISLPEDGDYWLQVHTDRFSGKFLVSWQLK